jgi:hypothetical protein
VRLVAWSPGRARRRRGGAGVSLAIPPCRVRRRWQRKIVAQRFSP